MASFFDYFFHWYSGGVWSNLLASILWAAPSLFVLEWRTNKRHKELHNKLDALHEHLLKGDK